MKPSLSVFVNESRRGFTLVELIVATGITLVLATMLIGVTGGMLSAWNQSRGKLSSANQAKLALDQLAADLACAVTRADGAVWLAATIQPDQSGAGDSGSAVTSWDPTGGGTMKPGNGAGGSLQLIPGGSLLAPENQRLEDFRFGMAATWLRLFTTEPDSNDSVDQTSAVRAVGYQILRFSPRRATSRIYGLFRSSVRPTGTPNSTFGVGYELFSTDGTNPTEYNVGDASSPGNAGTVRRPRVDALLANNVIDFGVRFWARNSGGVLSVIFPTSNDNLGFAARTQPVTGSESNAVPLDPAVGAPTFAQMTYGFPEVAEIFVRVLTDEGAAIVEAIETGKRSGDWWEAALEHSVVYTRRVEVKGRAR